jgi:Uma2 family endonuclease
VDTGDWIGTEDGVSAEPLEHVELGAVMNLATLLQTAVRRPLTVDDLLSLDATDAGRMELIDGSLIVTPIADLEHQDLVMQLCLRLSAVLPTGMRVLPGFNVILEGGGEEEVLTIPDVAVVDPAMVARKGLGVPPDGLILGVEITSPSTRRRDLTTKRDLYAGWNVPLVIVDRKITPHRYTVFGDVPGWARDALSA